MCRRQFSKPRIEDVFIKGTGLRTKLDVRRVWKCPHCERTVKLRGRETSKTCNCGGETRFMRLQEDLRWTRPHQPIKSVVEVRPDPDEFPDPPKQELPVEPEVAEAGATTGSEADAADISTSDADAPVAEEETLITSALPSISEMLSAEDDDEGDSPASTDGPSGEKSRPGRKRKRRRRRKRGGASAEGKSNGASEATAAATTEAASGAATDTGSPTGTDAGDTDAPKKKRRRRRRRRKNSDGSSGESTGD